jgi:hypothetical protein
VLGFILARNEIATPECLAGVVIYLRWVPSMMARSKHYQGDEQNPVGVEPPGSLSVTDKDSSNDHFQQGIRDTRNPCSQCI